MKREISVYLDLIHEMRPFGFIRLVVQIFEFIFFEFIHRFGKNFLIGIKAHIGNEAALLTA